MSSFKNGVSNKVLLNKNQYHTYLKPSFTLRLLLALAPVSMLTACTTTYIAGIDQVLFPNSSAQVGPLITANEQYPKNDKEVLNTLKADSSDISPIESSGDLLTQESNVETKLKPEYKFKPTIKPVKPIIKTVKPVAKTIKPVAKTTVKNKVIATEKTVISAPVVKKTAVKPVTPKQGSINGKVVLIDKRGETISAQGTLITLTPQKTMEPTTKSTPKTHVIDMQDKEYQTRYSSINAGDQVVFVNKDKIQHNVFSPSGNNAFDLGTYGSGLKRAVTLKEPGVVKVYCNIHADMATFVAVGKEGLSAKADNKGHYKITNLPIGLYDLTIWNIHGETTRTIEVTSGTINLDDRIDTTVAQVGTHKNKFGDKYSNNASLFEDEFY